MNASVPIDDEAVRAELRDIEQEHAALPAQPAPGDELAPAAEPVKRIDWTLAAAGLVRVFDRGIAPNWQLDRDECAMLQDSVRDVLAAFFPDAIDPRVQACLALAGAVIAIGQARVDPATGKLRPMRAPKPAASSSADAGEG